MSFQAAGANVSRGMSQHKHSPPKQQNSKCNKVDCKVPGRGEEREAEETGLRQDESFMPCFRAFDILERRARCEKGGGGERCMVVVILAQIIFTAPRNEPWPASSRRPVGYCCVGRSCRHE